VGFALAAERIYRVLESGRRFSTADMLSLQTDVYSAFDRLCAERFVYALDHTKNPSRRAQQARDLMRDWDGRLHRLSAATIENRAQYELRRLLLEAKLGPDPKNPAGKDSPAQFRTPELERLSLVHVVGLAGDVLQKQPKRWLPEGYETYEALLRPRLKPPSILPTLRKISRSGTGDNSLPSKSTIPC